MRNTICKACSFNRHGVRTRIAFECTCGSNIPRKNEKVQYIPTREELDRYLALLAKQWDFEKNEWKKQGST